MKKNINTLEEKNSIEAKFLSQDGNTIFVKDVISQEDCWFLKREKKWVLKHDAIKKLARIAGISPNYDVDESKVNPSYDNELEHIVRVTIHCNAPSKNPENNRICIHDTERNLVVTGEANRISTPNRGRGYLRKMAEKRAYDIAVLEHLGIYSTFFSDAESGEFEQEEKDPGLMPGTVEFEDIAELVNEVVNAPDVKELTKIGLRIRKNKDNFTENQINYLRKIFQKQFVEKNTKSKPF